MCLPPEIAKSHLRRSTRRDLTPNIGRYNINFFVQIGKDNTSKVTKYLIYEVQSDIKKIKSNSEREDI